LFFIHVSTITLKLKCIGVVYKSLHLLDKQCSTDCYVCDTQNEHKILQNCLWFN